MKQFSDRRVTIIGMAREGMALARFFSQVGAHVTVSDLRGVGDLADEVGALAGLPVTCVLRGHPPDLLDTDVMYLSPGVPRDASIVQQARARNVPLSSLTELFFELCPAPIIGVTGSAGKTTTTTLIGEMIKAERRRKSWVGGNIGEPLIEYIEDMRPDHWVVLELSSFQLEPLRQSPHVAVITNLRPNHLERHKTFEAYKSAKLNILRFQSADDLAVLNWDDPEVRDLADDTEARVLWYSRREPVPRGAYFDDGWLVVRDGESEVRICRTRDVALPGGHNQENLLAAACVTRAIGVKGAPIGQVATTFTGVEHRLEWVRTCSGVEWFNDSIATSPDRTVAALRAFDDARGRIVLLAGGRDKHLPIQGMINEILDRVKYLVLFGEMAPMLEAAVEAAIAETNGDGRSLPVRRCHTLEEAVAVADSVATAGDLVLLSPAGTSFDAFEDFEERGRRFKELVADLSERRTVSHEGRPLRAAVN